MLTIFSHQGYLIPLTHFNVLQISEGTNSVGLCGWIWAFAYVLLADVIYPFRAWDAHNIKNKNNVTINEKPTINKY
jgi:hypothetical protein